MNNFIGTFRNKDRPPFIIIWLGWMISSFLGIIDGILNIISLGMWFPGFQMEFVFWNAKFQLRKWK